MERLHINVGKSPTTQTSILLDEKYDSIRSEAINAGILLKETDEKVDEMINDGQRITSHAQDVRANALRFVRNLMQSEKLVFYCQLIFIVTIVIIAILFIGKVFIGRRN